MKCYDTKCMFGPDHVRCVDMTNDPTDGKSWRRRLHQDSGPILTVATEYRVVSFETRRGEIVHMGS
jgi:hypothetical protein